jgi:hypothetical protein
MPAFALTLFVTPASLPGLVFVDTRIQNNQTTNEVY